MRDYEALRDKIKNWTRTVLEGDYINQSRALDYLNDKLVDCNKKNDQLKEALNDLLFAYKNKDVDCPHGFEVEAVSKANGLLTKESEGK